MNMTKLALAGAFDDVSWDEPQTSIPIQGGGYSNTSDAPDDEDESSGGGAFWKGANLMGILNLVGGTVVQLQQAKKGNPVYVKDSSGNTTNIAPQLLQRFEQEARANKTTTDNLLQMMQMQMMKQNQPPPPKDNTALYIGLGVGGLVILGGVIYITSKKK